MPTKELQTKAHYLAYRWFRTNNLEATHVQGWEFAEQNWRAFMNEAVRELTSDESDVLVDA